MSVQTILCPIMKLGYSSDHHTVLTMVLGYSSVEWPFNQVHSTEINGTRFPHVAHIDMNYVFRVQQLLYSKTGKRECF